MRQRWLGALRDHLQRSDVRSSFGAINASLRLEMSTMIQDHVKRIQDGLRTTRNDILADFEAMTKDNANDPTERVLRERLQGCMATTEPRFKQLKAQLGQLEADYQ